MFIPEDRCKMRITSIGLYNPIPINTGSDSYIYYLLNSISQDNEVLHYYCSKLKSSKGYIPNDIGFKTKYLESKLLQKIPS